MDPPVLDYATPTVKPRSRRWLVAIAPLALASCIALRLWAELAYRFELFLQNRAEPGANHWADGAFRMVYAAGTLGILSALLSAWLLRRRWHRIAAISLAAAIAAACGLFELMHRTGVLVEYGEFLRGGGLAR